MIDGHSLIFRSFFAFVHNPLRNAKGVNTSAVFGFANTLRRLLEDLKPGYCAVVFDAPGKTFRHEKFEGYKMQRPSAPDELVEQIPVVRKMVKAWGIADFEVPGVEADDVLGTLALRFAGLGFEVTLATSDKDLLQLVSDSVSVYDPWKRKRYGSEDVREKYGVGPELLADFLALTGDSADNIPGVPGIGPKRALHILENCGSLDDAIAKDKRLSGHEQAARLSRELVELDTAVDVDAESVDLAVGDADAEALREIFLEVGAASLLADLDPLPQDSVEVTEFNPDIDFATTPSAGFCFVPGRGLWFTVDGERVAFVAEAARDNIKRIVEDPGLLKVGLNVKQQVKSLRRSGFELRAPVFDVGVGAWLVDPNRRRYRLEDLTVQLLGRVFQTTGPEGEPGQAFRLFKVLEPQLPAMGLERVAEELEMPLPFVLAAMEERGVKVDVEFLGSFEQELAGDRGRVEQEIWRLAGVEFNVGSPKQLGEVLFGQLGLPKGKKTKTGYSTSSAVLESLIPMHPMVKEVLRYRELAKLSNTYVKPLMKSADSEGHRVHADFNQTGTATGRLSSSNPNLQSIPIRTELGRRMRNGIVADEGMVLISADYSQIELRVLAHVSGDEKLRRAFAQDEDVHVQTAATIFDLEIQDVSSTQRRLAKVVNYGIIYGMGDFGLASRMGIPLERARSFLDEYLRHFSGVAEWRERTMRQAEADGFVRTIAGRMRPVPEIASRNRNVADAARRAALNAPIQGSAADIVKKAMLRLDERFRAESIAGGMLAQIHDELLCEVNAGQAEAATEVIRDEMENAWQLDVPLKVDVGVGSNWGEAH